MTAREDTWRAEGAEGGEGRTLPLQSARGTRRVLVTAHNITLLEVPVYGDPRAPVQLRCQYARGSEDPLLHSVKWYHDNDEIFRYTPGQKPPTRIFNTTSVGATHGSCNEYSCTISVQLPHRYTARLAYTCEVSTEGPRFAVVKQTKTVTIAAILAERPVITGAPASAHPGEKLQLNCSTGYAMPPANIAWYIDGKLIEPDLSIGERTVTSVPDDFGRRTSWRANQLRVTTLRTTIHVRCVATQPMDPPYVIDANATIIVPKSPHLSMFTASNGDVSKVDARCGRLVALALVIHRLCKSSAFSDRDAD